MTNYESPQLRASRLADMGYSTREIEEEMNHQKNSPTGSYFANALAFIVESINDGMTITDIRTLDYESMMEFGEMYNFTEESLSLALEQFEKAAQIHFTGTR